MILCSAASRMNSVAEVDEAEALTFHDFEDESFRNVDPSLDESRAIISMPFSFSHGRPRSVLLGETTSGKLTIKNAAENPLELSSVKIRSSNPSNSFALSLKKNSDEESEKLEVNRLLRPGKAVEIWVSCRPKEVGMHAAVIQVCVDGDKKLEKAVFLLADDPLSLSLASFQPFAKSSRGKKKFSTENFVPAFQRPRLDKKESGIKLPPFAVPAGLRSAIQNRQVPRVVEEGLNEKNYAAFFSTLLFMEEIYLEEKMRGYDIERAEFTKKGKKLVSLVVRGLAEKRPSLLPGDYLFAKPNFKTPGEDPGPFQGYIRRINAEEIYVVFSNKFLAQHRDYKPYHVTFCYNRLSMRKLHHAVETADAIASEILFPCKSRRIQSAANRIIVPFDKNLNQEQIRSVEKILACCGSPPYIIHGPPGTGKTVTIVEAILQIRRRDPTSRILACAPSNSASDHILRKLVSSAAPSTEILRLNAPSRQYKDVDSDIVPFCFVHENRFQRPSAGTLLRYGIIISTYVNSFQLCSEDGLRHGHFDYIFLDEAGQASEPEAMIPLMGLWSPQTTVVLAGDPMQLGPVVSSPDADGLGLGKSYLQRLFDVDFYADQHPDYMTKLVRNYRSHAAILSLPSRLFYEGELLARKEERSTLEKSTVDFLSLPNKEFPVLFVGVQGCDEREGSSPSWFNRTEVSKVVEIVRRIRSTVDFSGSNIGVVAPYLQQVTKLQRAFESVEIDDVTVGSVEKFQGQERDVIVISTVRSTDKHKDKHGLGFLTNPRRFNVAITRARSLLVVVGNPHVISKDPFWMKLLRYCKDNGSYQGCPLPPLGLSEVGQGITSEASRESS